MTSGGRRLGGAFVFILFMGVVSLFSDMTHEGAASIMGAYLSLAGASAAAIGFISGLGESIGYSLRLVSGYYTDRSRNYWGITIAGYIVDCLAVPALALVPQGGWKWACALIVIQRVGKAVKKPAKDTILSFAASQAGAGKSFAVQELLDQIGAVAGPLMLFFALWLKRGMADQFRAYSMCFALLLIPALITIGLLFYAKSRFPAPESFEREERGAGPMSIKKDPAFILFIIAVSLFAAGYVDFPLITMHLSKIKGITPDLLPLFYAWAMAADAAAALVFGWLFDKRGVSVLFWSTLASASFAYFIFIDKGIGPLITGVTLWGIGMGAQESVFKAAVTKIVPKRYRSTGFGLFQTFFGVSWFLGSWFMGWAYDSSPMRLVLFSVLMQAASLPFFILCSKRGRKSGAVYS